MSTLIVFLAGFLLGGISAVLAYRNNQAKIEAEVGKTEADLLAQKAKIEAALNTLKK